MSKIKSRCIMVLAILVINCISLVAYGDIPVREDVLIPPTIPADELPT